MLRLQPKLCHTWEKRGWCHFWRCAHLVRLLLCESTCSPSLWPFSILTAAAIFLCCLFPPHIRSKNGELLSQKEFGWVGMCWVSEQRLWHLYIPRDTQSRAAETLLCHILVLTRCVKKEMRKLSEALPSVYLECEVFTGVSLRKGFTVWELSEVFERACSRCGFASKMEGALFMLQTCSERIPWGGVSCANLFHNDWNVTEPKPWKFHRAGYTQGMFLLKKLTDLHNESL